MARVFIKVTDVTAEQLVKLHELLKDRAVVNFPALRSMNDDNPRLRRLRILHVRIDPSESSYTVQVQIDTDNHHLDVEPGYRWTQAPRLVPNAVWDALEIFPIFSER